MEVRDEHGTFLKTESGNVIYDQDPKKKGEGGEPWLTLRLAKRVTDACVQRIAEVAPRPDFAPSPSHFICINRPTFLARSITEALNLCVAQLDFISRQCWRLCDSSFQELTAQRAEKLNQSLIEDFAASIFTDRKDQKRSDKNLDLSSKPLHLPGSCS